jgi:hypothetical protein
MYTLHSRHDVIAAHTRTSPSFTLASFQSIVTSAAMPPLNSLRSYTKPLQLIRAKSWQQARDDRHGTKFGND